MLDAVQVKAFLILLVAQILLIGAWQVIIRPFWEAFSYVPHEERIRKAARKQIREAKYIAWRRAKQRDARNWLMRRLGLRHEAKPILIADNTGWREILRQQRGGVVEVRSKRRT